MTIIARYAEPISIDHEKDSKERKSKNRRKNYKYGRPFFFHDISISVMWFPKYQQNIKELYSNFQSIYPGLPRKIRK